MTFKTKKNNHSFLPALSRRKLMAWSVPTVSSIVLPAHAQTSVCNSVPLLSASSPSKCSGVPPVGEASLSLISSGSDVLEIISIAVQGASATDTVTLPMMLPSQIMNTVGLDIRWVGDATDATTCLPLSDITFEVGYRCAGNLTIETANFNLTDILVDALP